MPPVRAVLCFVEHQFCKAFHFACLLLSYLGQPSVASAAIASPIEGCREDLDREDEQEHNRNVSLGPIRQPIDILLVDACGVVPLGQGVQAALDAELVVDHLEVVGYALVDHAHFVGCLFDRQLIDGYVLDHSGLGFSQNRFHCFFVKKVRESAIFAPDFGSP